MRTKIWLLVVSAFLFSCGTSRKVVKISEKIDSKTEETAKTVTEEKILEVLTIKTEAVQDEEIVTEIVEFDTSLPADPTTKTSPIKRKTTQTKRLATKAQQTIASDVNVSAVEIKDVEKINKTDTVTSAEETSKRGLNFFQNILCASGIVAILIFIVWAVKRRFKYY